MSFKKWFKENETMVLVGLLSISITIGGIGGYNFIKSIRDKNTVDNQLGISQKIANPFLSKDKNPYLSVDLKPLKEKNNDVVGWLKVGGVGIDMPIVQTTDNKYYLEHDLDKKSSKAGWVFVDNRSSLDYLDTNTVLYGHNLKDRQFGLLKQFLEPDVASKKGANIVQLTTEDREMVFEIVSMYVTTEKDWGYANVGIKETKEEFVKRLKSRNEVKEFQTDDLGTEDNYITFSTCHGAIGTTKRLVTHAKLVASRAVK